MLEDVAGIRKVVLACGTVDLRKGIDGLAMIIGDKYKQNPFEKGTLFLFCGQRSDRIKGLLWMGTGFLLLYKRFEDGRLSWPRTTQEAAELTEEQFHYLMLGLNPLEPKIKDVEHEDCRHWIRKINHRTGRGYCQAPSECRAGFLCGISEENRRRCGIPGRSSR